MQRFETAADKEAFVQGIFTKIAPHYDLLNSIISFKRDAYWRSEAVKQLELTAGANIIDVACGTCKITEEILRQVGTATVNALDFNPEMIDIGQHRISEINKGDQVHFCVGDAMNLPYKDACFDGAISAFALRNVPDIPTVLLEMKRVVKPGGKVVILELAKPNSFLFKHVYKLYFNKIMPALAKISGGDSSYSWLCESWRGFMHQKELKFLFEQIGLKNCGYKELTGGVVAVHYGTVPNKKED